MTLSNTKFMTIVIALTITFATAICLAINPAYADSAFVSKTDDTVEKKPMRTAAAKSISKKALKAKIKQIQDLEYRARLGRIPCDKANREINKIARSIPLNIELTLEEEQTHTGYAVDPHDTGCYVYLYPRH